jgi:DNA transformation protein
MMNLGPKSTQWLKEVGIHTKEDLERIGPIEAYLKVKEKSSSMKPSLLLLYALVGAVKEVHWQKVAREEKEQLLMELDGYKELQSEIDKLLNA